MGGLTVKAGSAGLVLAKSGNCASILIKNYESKYNFLESSRTKTTKKETDKGEILFLESNPFSQTALGLNSVFMYSEICESASLVSRLCLSYFFLIPRIFF